jgi:hypothetical protein
MIISDDSDGEVAERRRQRVVDDANTVHSNLFSGSQVETEVEVDDFLSEAVDSRVMGSSKIPSSKSLLVLFLLLK